MRAGARVRALCAERGIPSSIEMGGKDAAIVLADVDLDRAIPGITHWTLSNAGQACGAIEVAYVDEQIADAFVARVSAAFAKLRTHGAPDAGEDPEIGPLGNADQLATVEAHVADAVAKGAKLVCGGARAGQGFGYLPTVLDRCTSRMDVVKKETFGPVLAVVRVRGAEEAVLQVNASDYGLGASVWTRDAARGRRIAERLDVGVAIVNNHAFTGAIPALPWSGTRETGFGVANSRYSLLTFTRPKVIVVDGKTSPEVFFMPYDKALHTLGHALADAQIGRLITGRAWRIPLLLRKRVATVRDFFSRK
jgi:succinate-semialdehyde dehydrogenase/glutarate-semialdehyde dehydrogenase